MADDEPDRPDTFIEIRPADGSEHFVVDQSTALPDRPHRRGRRVVLATAGAVAVLATAIAPIILHVLSTPTKTQQNEIRGVDPTVIRLIHESDLSPSTTPSAAAASPTLTSTPTAVTPRASVRGKPRGSGGATHRPGPGTGVSPTPSPHATPRTEVRLGGFEGDHDLNAYCIHLGYREAFTSTGDSPADHNWICRGSADNDTEPQSGFIDFSAACRWAFSGHTVTRAVAEDPGSAFSWSCYGYA